jgi:hypothetical protein
MTRSDHIEYWMIASAMTGIFSLWALAVLA